MPEQRIARRKPDPERRRRELCDAAIQLLADNGANGLTHRKVDQHAGVPAGTTSFYFRTRSALLRAAAERLAELDLAELQATMDVVSGDGEGAAAITAGLAENVMRSGTEPWASRTKARYELMLHGGRDPDLAKVLAPTIELYEKLHREIVLRLRPDDVGRDDAEIDDAAFVTMMFLNGVMMSFARADESIAARHDIDRLLSRIVAGLALTADREPPPQKTRRRGVRRQP
jgi:DNA-binding transcriptional regulator YbjK